MDVPGLHVLTAVMLVAVVTANPCRDVNMTMKTSVGNSCFFMPTQSLTWTRARRECMSHQGHLAAVNRSSAMEAVRVVQALTQSTDLWVGGVLQGTGYKWDDGSALTGAVGDYPWSVPVDTAAAAENCVYVDGQAGWRLGACSAYKGYICQFDGVNRNCSSSSGSDVITLGRVCYMVQYGAASWFVARAQCASLGGHVTRLGNQTVYQRLVVQLQGAALYRGQELWTGLRRARWVWVTGEEVVWTSWERTEPDGAATCLSVHKYSPSAVLWRTAPCATPLNFVCQRDVVPSTAVGSTTTAPPQGHGAGVQSGLLLLLLLLLVVLAVIVIFLVCYYRRGRALRKEARERAKERGLNSQNNNADVEYRPNYSIFTTSNDTNSQLPQSNGHVRLHNDIEKASTPDSLRQNGRMGDTDALIQNNNKAKGSKTNLNSSLNAKKKISKSASKYQDPVEGDYDFDAEDAKFRNGKVSDNESVFKDIYNFDPPLPAHMAAEDDTNVYHQTIAAGSRTPSLKRSNPVYQSSELFSVRSSMRIPLPKAHTEESLVMESIQADDQDVTKARDPIQQEEDLEDDTDRSKYIEDVAKAFDFLVTGDGSPADESVLANPPPPDPAPPVKATKDGESFLKKRARRDSMRSVDKNYVSGNESDKMEYDMAKAQRRLYGEKERAGSRRKKEKPDQGTVNGGFTVGESDVDEESRRRKHKHRSHAKEGATGGTDSELDDDRRNRHKHHRHKYTEEELDEKRRRRKEREQQKQGTQDRDKKIELQEDEDGLTRVGSPPPLGKLPPLGPLAPINTDEKKKRHRDKHRKHRKDMTPEELEERRRHHKRKKEKERRRRERELQGKQVEPNRIEVSGKAQEVETEDSDGSDFSDDETGSVTGSAAGTPKKSPGSSARTTDRSRRPSLQGGPVYDIDNLGAGVGFEV